MSPSWVVATAAVASLVGGAVTHAVTYTIRHASLMARVNALERATGLAPGEPGQFIRRDNADLRFDELRKGQAEMAVQIEGLRLDLMKVLVKLASIAGEK